MSHTTASTNSESHPVRIVGVPTEPADHPALRKIARAVLSIAARRLAEDAAATPAPEQPHD